MKLKNKLIIGFFIMIVLPIILISATGRTIIGRQMDSIKEAYDIESGTIEVLTNPIQIFNRVTRGVYNDIKL
ncbi:MAG TPA: two-component sensor histidine kinase, partial [Clostridiales bacterium]|nr:two-component sensor histidine kinase [Clostridiales bacterium]